MKSGKILFYISFLLLITLLTQCNQDEVVEKEEEEREETPFVPRADKATVLSGRNRLLIVWPNPPKEVAKMTVFWNNGTNSLEYPLSSHPDTLNVYINDLEEGTYSLEIFTYDAK